MWCGSCVGVVWQSWKVGTSERGVGKGSWDGRWVQCEAWEVLKNESRVEKGGE